MSDATKDPRLDPRPTREELDRGGLARLSWCLAVFVFLCTGTARASESLGTYQVRIFEQSTDRLVPGATFTLTGPNGFRLEGTTDTRGTIEIPFDYPLGRYALRVRAEGYRERVVRFVGGDIDRLPAYVELFEQKPVEPGPVPHRIASDQTTPTDQNSLLEIGGLLAPAPLRRLLSDPASLGLSGWEPPRSPAPLSILTFLDRVTAKRQRFARPTSGNGPSVPVAGSGNLGTDAIVAGPTFGSERWNAITGFGPSQGFARTRFDEDSGFIDFATMPIGGGFGATPILLDRRDGPSVLSFDTASRRWLDLDLTGSLRVAGGFDRPSGNQLAESTGGLQPQAVATPDGGTLLFTSRTKESIPAGFSCNAGTSRQHFTRFDKGGNVVDDTEIPSSAFPTQIGESCFPPHTTESSAFLFGSRWAASFQSGDQIVLATTGLSGLAAATSLFELVQQPSSLDGVFFWRPAVLGDPDSGGFLVDVPNGPTFEGSEDGDRLGFAPWEINNTAFDLPLTASSQLLRHALAVDLKGAPWRIGTFERRALDGAAPAGERAVAEVPLPGCLDNERTLCLVHNRFALTARYETTSGKTGAGRARSLSNEAGTFWFFEPDNRELIVKVLPACNVNGHYWLFAAGLTDVGVQLSLTDPETGIGNHYVSPVGRPFEPILDTEALACSEIDGKDAGRSVGGRDRTDAGTQPAPRRVGSEAHGGGEECGGRAGDLCLADGRFRVEVDYTDFAGATAPAFGGNLTEDTGALFFFDRSNVEMLVKVLDACVFGNYWLFAAGLTNVGVELRVTDTATGVSRTYENAVGSTFQPISDTASFPCS